MLNSKLPGLCKRKSMEDCLWAKIYLPILVYSVWHSSVKKCISLALPIHFPVWKMRGLFFLYLSNIMEISKMEKMIIISDRKYCTQGYFSLKCTKWFQVSRPMQFSTAWPKVRGKKRGGEAIILTVYKKGSAMFHVDSLLWHRRKCRCDEWWFNKQKTKNSLMMPL